MTPEARHTAFATLARALSNRDLACYARNGRDPDVAILGEGPADAEIALFGRDPGREEVRHGVPFVGAGGQKLRAGLHRARFGTDPATFEDSLRAGEAFFWANMVPYKPFENVAWPRDVVRAFRPYVVDLLLVAWRGTQVITLGEGAFRWFGLDDRDTDRRLAAHWKRADRFETPIDVELRPAHRDTDAAPRTLSLHALPHPSPLNATWTPRFPGLLHAQLQALGVRADGRRAS